NLPSECFTWFDQLKEKQDNLDRVAGRFREQVMQLCNGNPVVEDNQPLQDRIKAAANYFSKEITQWQQSLHNHSLSTDTKKTSRKIDNALDEVNITVQEILHGINHCKNGFILNNYIKDGKKLLQSEIQKIQSSYAQYQKKT